MLAGLLATCSAVARGWAGRGFHRRFRTIITQAYLRDNPIAATYAGVKDYDRDLGKIGPDEAARQVAAGQGDAGAARCHPGRQPDRPPSRSITRSFAASSQNTIDGSLFGANFISYSSRGTLSDNLGQYLAGLPLRSASRLRQLSRAAGAGRPDPSAADRDRRRLCRQRLCPALLDPRPARQGAGRSGRRRSRQVGLLRTLRQGRPRRASRRRAGPRCRIGRARSSAARSRPRSRAFGPLMRATFRPKCLNNDSVTALPDGKAQYDYLVRYPHHHRHDPGADPCARPQGSRADPLGNGGAGQEIGFRQPRGDDRRHAHQPQIFRQDARRADAGRPRA